jgi:hypothetical protein
MNFRKKILFTATSMCALGAIGVAPGPKDQRRSRAVGYRNQATNWRRTGRR